MATDATGTPTSPDGIPKYNTSVDAPSGLGFNSAMDQLQVALTAKVAKPSGIATGEVPVWNGSAFVRSSVTNINTSNVSGGVAMQKIADGATAGSPATVTFSAIPQTYKHLRIVWRGYTNQASTQAMAVRFNGDVGTNYEYSVFEALNGVANVGRFTATTGMVVGVLGPSSSLGGGVIEIPDYAAVGIGGRPAVGTYSVTGRVGTSGGVYLGSVATGITSILIYDVGGFGLTAAGAFTLYGLS